ncbi:MarR family winged helix-turn-helix transcriptional regulator [Propioniciclava soli]|uniref:MarR family winged helix-turn-helix transcriptional regulator n=1 Tax=Propioniciclava soli TaxID=2775081 RepID=UPI001E30F5BF
MDETPEDALPLVALLGQAHDALEAAFDERLGASPFSDLSLAHSRNVLRHVGRGGCARPRQVAELSGVSKQAVSLQIAHLERAGYLRTLPDPSDGRARVLELTARGRSAQRWVLRTMRELDALWRDRWGEDVWSEVRGRLREVVAERGAS